MYDEQPWLPQDEALTVLARDGDTDPCCSCRHDLSAHPGRGPCADQDSYGLTCGCTSFELSQEWHEAALDGDGRG